MRFSRIWPSNEVEALLKDLFRKLRKSREEYNVDCDMITTNVAIAVESHFSVLENQGRRVANELQNASFFRVHL